MGQLENLPIARSDNESVARSGLKDFGELRLSVLPNDSPNATIKPLSVWSPDVIVWSARSSIRGQHDR
jgi:hypothetical protein